MGWVTNGVFGTRRAERTTFYKIEFQCADDPEKCQRTVQHFLQFEIYCLTLASNFPVMDYFPISIDKIYPVDIRKTI